MYRHSIFVFIAGWHFCWFYNRYRHLGSATLESRFSPRSSPSKVRLVRFCAMADGGSCMPPANPPERDANVGTDNVLNQIFQREGQPLTGEFQKNGLIRQIGALLQFLPETARCRGGPAWFEKSARAGG